MTDDQSKNELVEAYRNLVANGLNRGSSGNISVRYGSGMLITPSAIACEELDPSMIAYMELDAETEVWTGPKRPSTEWRFHKDILRTRPEMNAVVHTHAPYSTILSAARKPIPAVHYMMAAFGGPDIRVSGYARYGSAALSAHVREALEDRNGYLMANHGMVVGGADLTRTMWLAAELEELAHIYYHTELIDGAHILTIEKLEETLVGFADYGVQSKGQPA